MSNRLPPYNGRQFNVNGVTGEKMLYTTREERSKSENKKRKWIRALEIFPGEYVKSW